jgi:hypothetical protein
MIDHNGSAQPSEPIRILLSQIIDYAGLFPPSQATMSEAVLNFAMYRNSNYGWMLGRFVVPAARLDEFRDVARDFVSKDGDPWRLSVVAGEDINQTLREVATFNKANGPSIVCDVLEVKANTVSKIENTVKALPEGLTAYFEIATGDAFVELVTTLSALGQRSKIRTGGVIHEDFPTSREIIRFVRTCMAANVPYKATAGLHHPLRCFKPLTYAANAPTGTMHGFLNMLVMTGFARESYRVGVLEEIMEEEFEEVFAFSEKGIMWRGEHFLPTAHLARLRLKGMNAFGSCSFDEPIADLQALGLL